MAPAGLVASGSGDVRQTQRFMAVLPDFEARILFFWFCSPPHSPEQVRLDFEAIPAKVKSQHVNYIDLGFSGDFRRSLAALRTAESRVFIGLNAFFSIVYRGGIR